MSSFLFSGFYSPQTWTFEEKGEDVTMSTPGQKKDLGHIPGRTVPSVISKGVSAEQRHRAVLKELGWDLTCYPSKKGVQPPSLSKKSQDAEIPAPKVEVAAPEVVIAAPIGDIVALILDAASDGDSSIVFSQRLSDVDRQSISIGGGSEVEEVLQHEVLPLLLVTKIDMNAEENSKIHHTTDYVTASPRVLRETSVPGTLIVLRGTEFTVKVLFNRPYNKEKDRLHFVFELAGEGTKVSKENLFSLDVTEGLKFASWSVCLEVETTKDWSTDKSTTEQDVIMDMLPIDGSGTTEQPTNPPEQPPETESHHEEKLEEETKDCESDEKTTSGEVEEKSKSVEDVGPRWQSFMVRTPPDCVIGKWTMSVDTIEKRTKMGGRRKLHRFTYKHPLYILFNAWNKADQVYMENDHLRDEYVLNEFGKIVTGNHKQITTKPWLFGQFDSFILDCCLHLLDTAGCSHKVRKDAAEICRALTRIITSNDNSSGLLLNAWAGNYGEVGVPPTAWTGSTSILEQYWRTRNPVKYGHCYVFAGVATTICRALGIPCRPVTNFSSAHDCDRQMTIDMHWCLKGSSVRQLNDDAIWSFHVWNEAWMRRPDLFENYSGWQAFDTTPQITSHGPICAGPCPVRAIKTGNVNIPHKTDLFFTEVNADITNWFFDEEGHWKSRKIKYRTGKALYTKKARPPHRRFLAVRSMKMSDTKDIDNITTDYKSGEGSEEDRSALYRADVAACHPGLIDIDKPDVKFEIKHQDDIIVGHVFDVIVKVQNRSRKRRTVDVTLELFTAYYTGVQKSRIKFEEFHFELAALRMEDAVVHVVAEEYLHRLADHSCFKTNVLCTVQETGQVFCEQEDFRLCKPELELDVPRKVVLGSSFDCKIHFMNPTPINLSMCEWILEATGIQRSIRMTQANMEPYEIADLKVSLTARKLGTQYVVLTFNSREMMDLNGVTSINVVTAHEDSDSDKECSMHMEKMGVSSEVLPSESMMSIMDRASQEEIGAYEDTASKSEQRHSSVNTYGSISRSVQGSLPQMKNLPSSSL